MRVLLWHVHGGYTDAFVRGAHEYLLPVGDEPDAAGIGLAGREWPAAREVRTADLRDEQIDVVVLQRPGEREAVRRLTGRVPGRDLPAVYLEHNTPKPDATGTVHPLADQDEIPIVHVTHFNRVFWDNGRARTIVVQHGVPDPGHRYTGDLGRIGVCVNEPVRRWRIVGADLLPAFARVAPVDVYGMAAEGLPSALGVAPDRVAPAGDLPPGELHARLARRRVYLHPFRWTSLGLSLLEAMHLGMPVVALAATEAARAVPGDAGVVSNDLDELERATARFIADPALAAETGRRARRHARERYGLDRFLARWDEVLGEVVASARRPDVALASPHPQQERSTR
ncbi:glycosyltransferase [Microbacterium sp. LRZ72]|uniref:glycosyltransferase n=1 Tax=Microbacterium sp. LRZ72 TaxID=2942481 RepID=UPI0029A022C5|nr:glycosyltransferase [Microbacterium sp. LRZ72]MDX2376735.1 glycosyltransferase [Microbacterium sp. LRZ72]